VKLNLGCGSVTRAGYVNVDIVPYKGVNLIANLNHTPFPFKEDSFDEVLCDHVLAHIRRIHQLRCVFLSLAAGQRSVLRPARR
jgi:predicted SAM-dependent methyltransferase